MLGQRAEVGVVVDEERHAEARAQRLEPALAPPLGKHDLREPVGMRGIDRAGDGDADADQALLAASGVAQAGVAELGDEGSRALGIGAHRVIAVLARRARGRADR